MPIKNRTFCQFQWLYNDHRAHRICTYWENTPSYCCKITSKIWAKYGTKRTNYFIKDGSFDKIYKLSRVLCEVIDVDRKGYLIIKMKTVSSS